MLVKNEDVIGQFAKKLVEELDLPILTEHFLNVVRQAADETGLTAMVNDAESARAMDHFRGLLDKESAERRLEA